MFFVELRPVIVMRVTGNDDIFGLSIQSREVRASWTSFGVSFLQERSGFGLNYGGIAGLNISQVQGFKAGLSGFLGPRVELFVPLTNVIGVNLQYDLMFNTPLYAGDPENDSNDPANSESALSQRLGLGLDLSF